MKDEIKKMQRIAGIITENEYRASLINENNGNKYITTDEDGNPQLNYQAVYDYLKSAIDPEYSEDVDIFMKDDEGWGESSSYFFDTPDDAPLSTEEEVEKWAKMEMSYYMFSKPDEFPSKNSQINENEYKYMDNDELISILTNIHNVYNDESFNETEPSFIEAAKHIKTAVDIIKNRSGN